MAHGGRKLFSVVLFCVVLAGGMAPSQPRHGTAVAAQDAVLTDLQDLGQLRDLFNQQAGVPRLILLLSPT